MTPSPDLEVLRKLAAEAREASVAAANNPRSHHFTDAEDAAWFALNAAIDRIPAGYLATADKFARLEAENARLREALADAKEWFLDYERQHLLKSTDDGDQKAAVNKARAERCARALNPEKTQ